MKKGQALKKVVAQVENKDLVKKKHEQIIAAAGKLFALKGYHSTTMRDIAAESGINLSYLYKYISCKDDILYLYYQYLYEQWAALYQSLDISNDEGPVEQLKKFVRSMLDISLRLKREIFTMITESRHLQPDSLHDVLSAESDMVIHLEKLVIRGVKKGVFKTKDSFMTANIIQWLLMIDALRSWNFSKRITFDELVEQITDFILSALDVEDRNL